MYILVLWCYIIFIQFATQGEWTFFHFLPSCCTIVSIVFTYSVTGITWHINCNTCNKSLCFTTCSTSIYFMICPKFFPASSYLNLSSVKPKHHLLPPMQPLLFLERFLTPFACLKTLIKTRFQQLSAMHLCLTHNVWLVIKSSQSLELCGRCDWTRHESPLHVMYNGHIHNVKHICMNINIKNFNICIHIV